MKKGNDWAINIITLFVLAIGLAAAIMIASMQ